MSKPNHSNTKGVFARLKEALFGGGAPEEPSPAPIEQYRKAVEIAWADQGLSEAELSWLRVLESELGLREEEASRVEREIMGGLKEEVVTSTMGPTTAPTDGIDRYRIAVEVAWADEKLNEAEKERLNTLQEELGLGWDQAGRIEREVMGSVKEEVLTYVDPKEQLPLSVDGSSRYEIAVRAVWVDKKLIEAERDFLSGLEQELGLGLEQSAEIEREVMGGAREEVVSLDPEPTPTPPPEPLDNEKWVDLAEECVEVVDELDRNMVRFDPPRQELADHVVWRLAEVLERSGVEIISDDLATRQFW